MFAFFQFNILKGVKSLRAYGVVVFFCLSLFVFYLSIYLDGF